MPVRSAAVVLIAFAAALPFACGGPAEVSCKTDQECRSDERCDNATSTCVPSTAKPDAASSNNNIPPDASTNGLPPDAGSGIDPDGGAAGDDGGSSDAATNIPPDAGTIPPDAGMPARAVTAVVEGARDITTTSTGSTIATNVVASVFSNRAVAYCATGTLDTTTNCCLTPAPPIRLPATSLNAGTITMRAGINSATLNYDAIKRAYPAAGLKFASGIQLTGSAAGGPDFLPFSGMSVITPSDPNIASPTPGAIVTRSNGVTLAWANDVNTHDPEASVLIIGTNLTNGQRPTVECPVPDGNKAFINTKLLSSLPSGSGLIVISRFKTASATQSDGSRAVVRAVVSDQISVTLR